MANFLKELYSQGLLQSNKPITAADVEASLSQYANQRGWQIHRGFTPENIASYRELTERRDTPLTKLITSGRIHGQYHIFAPTELIGAKYQDVLLGSASPISTRMQNFTAVLLGHESAELFERASGATGKFGSHASPSVIRTEFEIAKRLGPETFADTLRFRQWESKELAARGYLSNPHWQQYTTQMQDILKENLSLPGVSEQLKLDEIRYAPQIKRQKMRQLREAKELAITEWEQRVEIPDPELNTVISQGDSVWERFLQKQGAGTAEREVVAPINALQASLKQEEARLGTTKLIGGSGGGGGRSKAHQLGLNLGERLWEKKKTIAAGIGIGLGGIWLLNKAFGDSDEGYGLTKEQEEILREKRLGPKYSNLRKRLQGELAYDAGDQAESQRRFKLFSLALERYGQTVGTGHKRLLIPKVSLTKEDIEKDLGFVPVTVAIPEAGQTTFTSYRNPYNLYHLHEHKEFWTLHKDRHAAVTMVSKRREIEEKKTGKKQGNVLTPVVDFIKGLEHVVTEGVPGLYYYVKGQLTGTGDMAEKVLKGTSREYKRVLSFATGKYYPDSTSGLPVLRIPGKDDHYNTITGMSEKGSAAQLRKQNTDFGSGYKGQDKQDKQDEQRHLFTYLLSNAAVNTALLPATIGLPSTIKRYKSKYPQCGNFNTIKEWAAEAGVDPSIIEQAKTSDLANYRYDLAFPKEDFFYRYAKRSEPRVMLGNDLDIALSLHEIGHARTPLNRKPYVLGIKAGGILSTGSIIHFAYKYVTTKSEEDDSKLKGIDIAIGLSPAISQLPILAEEAQASIFALNLMRKKNIPKLGKAAIKLGLGFGTYVTRSILLATPLLTYAALNGFSGKDDAYNTIEGMSEKGSAAQLRKQNTDFGSGYKNSDVSDDNLFTVNNAAKLGITTAGAIGGYFAIYPWAFSEDFSKYPRLQEIRKVGSKYGLITLSPAMENAIRHNNSNLWSNKIQHAIANMLHGSLNPQSSLADVRNFPGVLYIRETSFSDNNRPIIPMTLNWGNWDIGVDKLKTWQYFKEKNIEKFHASSLSAAEFYSGKGKAARLSSVGQEFINQAGGLENIVVKRNVSALSEGVWLNATKLPESIAQEMLKSPEHFMLQQKLDLAAEFRAITVGGKSIYTAHRFGSGFVKNLAQEIRKKASNVPILGSILWNENIQPIINRETRNKLTTFVEEVAANIPYDIGAFDIGMTKAGEFKVIEAQRHFGSITNPVVSRRIKNVITDTKGKLPIATAIIGASFAYSIASLFFDKDDSIPKENRPVNGFDGMQHGGEAGKNRKENTPFGSKYDRARVLARMMDQTFEQFTRSTVFREALSNARVVRRLGEGYFGEVNLMETELLGETFQFARKTIKEGVREKLFREAAHPEKYLRSLDLIHESEMMRPFGMSETISSVYHSSPSELFSEFMPGKELGDFLKEGGNIPLEAKLALEKDIKEMTVYGIKNTDIHRGNILYDPESKRISWIDLGQAEKVGRKNAADSSKEMLAGANRALTRAPVQARVTVQTGLSFMAPFRKTVKAIDPFDRTSLALQLSSSLPNPILPNPIQEQVKSKIIKKGSTVNFRKPALSKAAEPLTVNIRKKPTFSKAIEPIPGKDDAYNVIEGMSEKGVAGKKRKKNTDYGSGFVTEMAGSTKAFIEMSKEEVRRRLKKVAEPFLEAAKTHPIRSLLSENELMASATVDISDNGLIKMLFFDPEAVLQKHNYLNLLKPESFLHTVKGHEVSELTYTTKIIQKTFAKHSGVVASGKTAFQTMADAADKAIHNTQFSTHTSTGVIVDEFLLAMKEGPEAWEDVKRFRMFESELLQGHLDSIKKTHGSFNNIKDLKLLSEIMNTQEYIKRVDKITKTMEKNWLPKFQEKNWISRCKQRIKESLDLKKAQQQIWHFAHNGGKGHSGYTGKHVKQLSRFGGQ